MADRIIRDELWNSVRWLDLPTDTHRLVYVSLIPMADDYGNVEGGPRRLYRWMHNFTQIKSEADSTKLMSDLQDADLVRRYEVDGKEYWHLPRFRNSRRYWSRKFPRSPYKEQDNQETAKNLSAGLAQTCVNPSGGVGVGVGVGVLEKQKSKPMPRKRGLDFAPPEWVPAEQWQAWVESRTKKRNPPTVFAMEMAVAKLDNLRDQGHSPGAVLAQSAFRGWAGLFPVKDDDR